jgi:hypothetical protein
LLVADLGVRNRLAHRLRRLSQGIGAKIDHPPILQFPSGALPLTPAGDHHHPFRSR